MTVTLTVTARSIDEAMERLRLKKDVVISGELKPQQLAAPAAEPLQPEAHSVWNAAKEAHVLAMPMLGKDAHVFQGPLRESHGAAAADMAAWRRMAGRVAGAGAVYNGDYVLTLRRLRELVHAYVSSAVETNRLLEAAELNCAILHPIDQLVARDQLAAKKEPVAAGAPLGGASDEELEKRFWDLTKGTDVKAASLQLAREAVAAERERCAGIVEKARRVPANTDTWSYQMGLAVDEIRSGG